MELFFKMQDSIGLLSFSGGKILYDNVEKLKKALEYMLNNLPQKTPVVVNLINIDFIDSAGLGFLVNLKKTLLTRESELALINIAEPVRQILQFTHVATYFILLDTWKEAVQTFKK